MSIISELGTYFTKTAKMTKYSNQSHEEMQPFQTNIKTPNTLKIQIDNLWEKMNFKRKIFTISFL